MKIYWLNPETGNSVASITSEYIAYTEDVLAVGHAISVLAAANWTLWDSSGKPNLTGSLESDARHFKPRGEV